MKRKYNNKILIVLFLSSMLSCNDFLEEEVYTQYNPDVYLQSEQGINSVIVSAYKYFHDRFVQFQPYTNEYTADCMWQFGGGAEATATLYMNYKWDPQTNIIDQAWNSFYTSIRSANALLDNIDNVTGISSEKVEQFKAEARFIRAAGYYYLWEQYGPVPIITTLSELNFEPVRASDQEFDSFLTTEFQAAADNLPITQSLWGKATKGAALALLSRYYLNSKQWEKAADVSKQVINLNQYQLFDGDLAKMFSVENEINEEIILSAPAVANGRGSQFMVYAFPPSYPVQDNWTNFGNNMCIRNSWAETYHPEDKRLGWFLFSYTDLSGDFQDLWDPNSKGRSVRCFKYVPDPNATGSVHGNDMSIIRYADVLLIRAETLNELSGPNQESVDLLNQIRARAGVPLYKLNDFSNKDIFRDAILDERGWEFVSEGLRRPDLIRHGKLILRAKERGVTNAQDYMTRFPIPQNEVDINPNMEQNPGY